MNEKQIETLAKSCAALARIECNGQVAHEPQEGDFEALFKALNVADRNHFRALDDWKKIEKKFTEAYLAEDV